MKTYNASAGAFILKLFAEQFGLHQNDEDTYNLWLTVGESWYSRLDKNNLSAEKMQKLAEGIDELVYCETDLFFVVVRTQLMNKMTLKMSRTFKMLINRKP